MKKIHSAFFATLLSVPALGLSGCGSGTQLVKNLEFAADNEDGHLIAGFDAHVEMGLGSLPEVKLPIYDPKSPSLFLGYLETHYDGGISVRVDVTNAAKVQVTDGALLPNGRAIPIDLPSDVIPIAIPVVNSNSKVYLAVGQSNIMAGVAVTLLANTSSGKSDWLSVLQQLQTNIFYPFQIATDLKGTAGMFTGEKVGVGVFAVKTMPIPAAPVPVTESAPVFASGSAPSSLKSLAELPSSSPSSSEKSAKITISSRPGATPVPAGTVVVAKKSEIFGLRTQYPTGSKMRKIRGALEDVRSTRLD